jgi:hypothetical protein
LGVVHAAAEPVSSLHVNVAGDFDAENVKVALVLDVEAAGELSMVVSTEGAALASCATALSTTMPPKLSAKSTRLKGQQSARIPLPSAQVTRSVGPNESRAQQKLWAPRGRAVLWRSRRPGAAHPGPAWTGRCARRAFGRFSALSGG